jgi:hypothetical protein
MNKIDKSQIQAWSTPRAKILGVPITKVVGRSDDGTLIVIGFFTSDNKDEVGDIITRAATERAIPKYRQWGNIRYMHLPRPVAKVVKIGSDDGLGWNEVEIKVIDPQTIFEVEQGLLKALSVGILLSFEDVDFLEDGGLIINDYTLVEISLVDHPANYDAVLSGVKGTFMGLAQSQGKEAVLQQLDELKAAIVAGDPDKEKDMPEQNDATEKAPVVEEEVKAPEADEVKEEAPVQEEVPEEEAPVEEQASDEEEEVPVEEQPAPEAEEEPAEEEAVEEEPKASNADVLKAVDALSQQFEKFTQAMAAAIEQLSKNLEAKAEAQVVLEQPEGEKEEKAMAEDEPELGVPERRDAAVPETELPKEEKPVEKSAQARNLRDALRKHFNPNQEK